MASTPLTFQMFDLKQQKELSFTLKEKIEEGSFGKVYLAESSEYKETLIGKTIDLQGPGFNIQYSPFHLLRSSYREIAYLQQLDLLVGYQHDKENKKMLIIMKRLPGIPEFRVKKNKRLAEYASFCALRDLHRKGISHMDPHQYNFIYDEKTKKAHAIDFGLAQDAGPFRQLRDFEQFLKLRRAPPSFTSCEGRATIAHFIDLYCTELKEYILAHRYETAQTVFCYAAVIIAALCGASVLGVASLLAQELIKATVLPSLSELLSTLQDHYELRAFNQRHRNAYRYFHYSLVGVLVVLQGFILALQLTSLKNSAATLFGDLMHFSDITVNSQAFWQGCISSFPVFSAVTSAMQLQALYHTCQYWYNNAEKYLFTQGMITATYQHKITRNAQPTTFLPLFKQTSPNKIPTPNTTDTQIQARLSPFLRN